MSIDEIEKLATEIDAKHREYTAFCEQSGNHCHEFPEHHLARALLAMLPLVRDALRLNERASKCHDRPYMGCPIDHSDIESALYDGIEALRRVVQ